MHTAAGVELERPVMVWSDLDKQGLIGKGMSCAFRNYEDPVHATSVTLSTKASKVPTCENNALPKICPRW